MMIACHIVAHCPDTFFVTFAFAFTAKPEATCDVFNLDPYHIFFVLYILLHSRCFVV